MIDTSNFCKRFSYPSTTIIELQVTYDLQNLYNFDMIGLQVQRKMFKIKIGPFLFLHKILR